MPISTYTVTIEVQVVLRDKSMVVHDPGSCASAVRQNVMNTLPDAYTKMGLRYITSTVHVEAKLKEPVNV
jgi:hypothetical protein